MVAVPRCALFWFHGYCLQTVPSGALANEAFLDAGMGNSLAILVMINQFGGRPQPSWPAGSEAGGMKIPFEVAWES